MSVFVTYSHQSFPTNLNLWNANAWVSWYRLRLILSITCLCDLYHLIISYAELITATIFIFILVFRVLDAYMRSWKFVIWSCLKRLAFEQIPQVWNLVELKRYGIGKKEDNFLLEIYFLSSVKGIYLNTQMSLVTILFVFLNLSFKMWISQIWISIVFFVLTIAQFIPNICESAQFIISISILCFN